MYPWWLQFYVCGHGRPTITNDKSLSRPFNRILDKSRDVDGNGSYDTPISVRLDLSVNEFWSCLFRELKLLSTKCLVFYTLLQSKDNFLTPYVLSFTFTEFPFSWFRIRKLSSERQILLGKKDGPMKGRSRFVRGLVGMMTQKKEYWQESGYFDREVVRL